MSRLLEPTEAPTGARSVSATYEKRLMLTAGRASMELGGKIAEKLGVEPIDAGLKTFPDGEVYCRYQESIRGGDIFIVQSICGSEREGLTVNDALVELMLMVHAAKHASATGSSPSPRGTGTRARTRSPPRASPSRPGSWRRRSRWPASTGS